MSKADQIREMVTANPEARIVDIARAVGCSSAMVSKTRVTLLNKRLVTANISVENHAFVMAEAQAAGVSLGTILDAIVTDQRNEVQG